MLTVALLVAGITALLIGGTALVRGASGIATEFGVSPLVVGLTVVAFGTSAPELTVNIMGSLQGETGLAFGNVVGSNIANLGLVLGSAALIAPVAIEGQIVRREVPLLLLGTAILVLMTLDLPLRDQRPVLDRADGLVLALVFGIFVYITTLDIMRSRRDPLITEVTALRGFDRKAARARNVALVVGGIATLALGGQLTLSQGVDLASQLGVSTVVIGMVAVAIGTSLPELVTSIVAAVQREPDLCVGNVVGSNIFNSLMVLPASALLSPMVVPDLGITDLLVSFGFAAALIPIFLIGEGRLSRPIGAAALIAYVGYLLIRVG